MIPSGKLRVLLILFLSSSLSNGMSKVDSTVDPFAMGNKPRKFSLGGIVDCTTLAGRERRESGHGDLHTFLHWTISVTIGTSSIAVFLFYLPSICHIWREHRPFNNDEQEPQEELELQRSWRHDRRFDEQILFASEMENRGAWQYLYI